MFLKDLFARKEPRRFSFTPFYYNEKAEEETGSNGAPRIRFKRLRRGVSGKKSVRGMVFLALLVLLFLWYFWAVVGEGQKEFKLEDIKIEEVR
ncbi:MAG: hypothetical protein D6743_19390 [Calditrichaeota bacterium]|nr:MAG: hypothetical protein D6743_19390 [Calditrichota bacterium]